MNSDAQAPRFRSLIKPRGTKGEFAAAVLLFLLGFAGVVQLKAHANAGLESLRQTDLVKILADVSARANQLQEQKASLDALKFQLTSGAGSSRAALQAARDHIDALRILSGQVGARGAGIELRITDLKSALTANTLVGLINELRDAGAEVIEISGFDAKHSPVAVRVVASTYFQSAGSTLRVQSQQVSGPYVIRAIGDGATMATALHIAGGSLDQLHQVGAQTYLQIKNDLRITALAPFERNHYAQSINRP